MRWYAKFIVPLLLVTTGCTGAARALADADENAVSQDGVDKDYSEEKRLVRHLVGFYEKMGRVGRPVRNSSVAVHVEFGLGLIKMDVLEKENVLTVSVWTRYQWIDEYLMWDPAEYGGVTSVKLPTHLIWMPDIMLYNTASTETLQREVLVVARSDGRVSWYPHHIFYSSCAIDVRRYPFDNQTCHMAFGSWTHNIAEIDLDLAFVEGIDLSTFQADFKDSSKWQIEKVTAEKIGNKNDSTGFAVVTFTLYLKRRLIFSSYILTFPVVFLSFLTLLVFWLPADSSDKSSLGLTIFGSLLLLLLILVEAAPPTAAAVPYLGLYYCFNIIIVILSIFLSTIVSKMGEKKNDRKRLLPIIRKIFFTYIARALCLKMPRSLDEQPPFNHSSCSSVHVKSANTDNNCGTWDNDTDPEETTCAVAGNGEKADDNCAASVNSRLDKETRDLCRAMVHYLSGKDTEDVSGNRKFRIHEEWKFLGSILDRIFLMLYVTIIIAALVCFFPTPHYN